MQRVWPPSRPLVQAARILKCLAVQEAEAVNAFIASDSDSDCADPEDCSDEELIEEDLLPCFSDLSQL